MKASSSCEIPFASLTWRTAAPKAMSVGSLAFGDEIGIAQCSRYDDGLSTGYLPHLSAGFTNLHGKLMPTTLPPTLPIAFAATNCKLVGKSPNGTQEYWSADIKAVRHKTFNKVFTSVLFVETPGEMVNLAGIESVDGLDRRIRSDAAVKQAEFIAFLRNENERDNAALPELLIDIFEGSRYATIGKATAAYLAARSLTHSFGVGYLDSDNEYKLIRLMPGVESGFDGNNYLPFDQMDD